MIERRTFADVILNAYRPRFEEQFKNHPKGKEIVEKLCSGDNPPELVDLWFSEAESYNWKALRSAERPGDENGCVTFRVIG